MKKSVLDIHDLQKMVPFFKSRLGIWIGKLALKWLSVDKVNTVHANNCHITGAAFTTSLLKDPLIDIEYTVHNEEILDSLPEGAFITVSNHPIGSLDGIILIDIFASHRSDFKLMVNGILANIGAMKENFISVNPDSGDEKKTATSTNINAVRLCLQQLKEKHPLGFFPAGAISFYDKKEKRIKDLPWAENVVRIIRKANIPVYPVYFDFVNSKFFYWLWCIHWKIRTLRIPAEAFNKRGKKVDVYIGNPITPLEISEIPDDSDLSRFLYDRTYSAVK